MFNAVSDLQPPQAFSPPDVSASAPPEPVATGALRGPPRIGQLTPPWRVAVVLTWIGAFLAYLAVWKASEEIGIGTWWLGPRSVPQPVFVRLIPFGVIAVVGILASYNVRRLPWIGLLGAVALAAIAVPDLSRSVGLAVIEFAIAGAVALVSLASFTGTYRAASPDPSGSVVDHA